MVRRLSSSLSGVGRGWSSQERVQWVMSTICRSQARVSCFDEGTASCLHQMEVVHSLAHSLAEDAHLYLG